MNGLEHKRLSWIVLGAIGVGAAFGCSRSVRLARPVASLAGTPEAASDLAALREGWRARKVDRTAAERFLARHPDDTAVPLAKVYLAFSLLDARDFVTADGVLATLSELPPGTTRDLATVARARSFRLHGAPQSALERLRPLVGKVVDEADRAVFLEEIALSALAAHDDYEALAYLDAWLRGVGEEDKDRVRPQIERLLETLPRAVLERTFRTMRARGVVSGYGSDTQRLVADRLARIAVETNDVTLARWLVDVSGVGAARTGTRAGYELGELAASRRGLATVAGKTVGLLLPARELRDEAADVVRGVSWALDLPRKTAHGEGVRLVTRDDGVELEGTRAALEELAGEGATVIVAGFDRVSADRALSWSEAAGVPVLLLSAPNDAKRPKKTAVVLGEHVELEAAMLVEGLARDGVRTAGVVVDALDDARAAGALDDRGVTLLEPVRCDVPLAEAGPSRFPVAEDFRRGARGWLVSGPTSCARELLRDLGEARAVRPPVTVALTLEAGVPLRAIPKGVAVLSASAGLVPIAADGPDAVNDDDGIRAFTERFGVGPSYWTALGHDAGVLAKGALAPLPTDTTTDPNAVVQRRAIVAAGLVTTRARLWTSGERGVGRDRVLARELQVVRWPARR